MKRITEPAIGFVTTFLTFEIWSNLLLSLILAFAGGALGYLGKHFCQQTIIGIKRRKIKVKHRKK